VILKKGNENQILKKIEKILSAGCQCLIYWLMERQKIVKYVYNKLTGFILM